MSWYNSNQPPRRPPESRRPASRANHDPEYPPLDAASLSGATFEPPMPRMIAAARERLANTNRDRINSILGDSPYTTRRWSPAPGESRQPRRHGPRLPARSQPPAVGAPAPASIPPPFSAPPPPNREFDHMSLEFERMTREERLERMEQLDHTLDEANAHLRALLDMTSSHSISRQLLPSSHPPNYSPLTRQHSFTLDSQRNKRRKVDGERYAQAEQSFRYGHYGQVEAGDLEMEMVSCDGGMFSNELSYAAENILKNDNSVYCTKGNRCNIVLRHRGSTAFTLSELIIKAPGSMNYSHPVREGMIFITMEQDDALFRTTHYQIQYAPSSSGSGSGGARDRDRVTFSNTDPRTRFNREPQQTVSVRHNDDGTSTTRPRQTFLYSLPAGDNEVRTPQMPDEFITTQPDFRISTECSDEEDDFGGGGSGGFAAPVSILRRPPSYRIGALPFETEGGGSGDGDGESDSDLDDDDGNDRPMALDALIGATASSSTTRAITTSRLRRGASSSTRHPANTSTANLLSVDFEHYSPLTGSSGSGSGSGGGHANGSSSSGGGGGGGGLSDAWDAHASAPQAAIRAVGGGALLAPHARFHIEKKKSKCTIRFDPPVSGRFILLKMWSSHHDPGSNIDIQSVLARGFAGPRYFPATEMR